MLTLLHAFEEFASNMYVFLLSKYSHLFGIDSPKIVNIDFRLRSKITTLMIGDSGARDNGDNESIIYLQTPTTEDFCFGSSVLGRSRRVLHRGCHDHDELSAPANNFRKILSICYKLN